MLINGVKYTNKKIITRKLNSGDVKLQYYLKENGFEFHLLYCSECHEVIVPMFDYQGKPYYKKYDNEFDPLICLKCFKINKSKYGKDSYKSIMLQYGDGALERFKHKTRMDYEHFKLRHGEDADEKYKKFVERSKHTKEKYINEYGKDAGEKRWEEYVDNKKITSKRHLSYWLKLYPDETIAKQKLKEHQTTLDKEKFIAIYGKVEGIKRYKKECKKKSVRIKYIKEYGFDEAMERIAKIYGFSSYKEQLELRGGSYTSIFRDKKFRTMIFQDQGFKCGICGTKTAAGVGFDLHHIDYDKKNDERNNLMWLCDSCHSKTTRSKDRESLAKTLLEKNQNFIIVSRNKTKYERLYEQYRK